MKPTIQLSAIVTESQAETLLQRLSLLPFNIEYREEQHGALIGVIVECTVAQEKAIRDTLDELGISIADSMEA